MENDSFFDKVKRYANVTTSVGGIFTRLLGNQLGFDINKDQHAETLKLSLGHLKGPLLKIAQILSTVPDMIPPEYAAAFQELQTNAPPMGWPFVKRRMRSELGDDWEQHFQSFSRQAVAAASLGQVHKATTHDGLNLACKLQYPGMHSAVETDLKQLKIALSLFETYSKSLSTTELQQEISERLYEELDYLREAKHIKIFSHIFRESSFVHVPYVVDTLTTPRLLSLEWLEGSSFHDILKAPSEFRNLIATNLFKAWYTPFYSYGLIHGDPHLGNYTLRPDASINLLDFGCIRIFPPKFVEGVLELYYALSQNDTERAIHAYEIWGFEDLNHSLIEVLNLWAHYLYGPLIDDRIRPIEDTFSGHKGQEIAGEVFKKLRSLGKISPPREFVFMDRAAVTLGSAFIRLRAEVNWHLLFEDLIQNFSRTTLEQSQRTLLSKDDL